MPDKAERVLRYQAADVKEAVQIMAAWASPTRAELHPHMLMRRVDHATVRSLRGAVRWLEPGELLAEPPADWAADWALADPDRLPRWSGARTVAEGIVEALAARASARSGASSATR